MKIKSFVICLSAFVSVCGIASVATLASVGEESTEQDPLASYQEIMDAFNQEYGTEYQFWNGDVLEAEESTQEELIEFFTAMSEDEFRDYLYDAYTSSLEEECYSDGAVIEANGQFDE